MEETKPDILIVGAGPTGLTAAFCLAQQGIPIRLIEQHAAPITTSNALAIQPLTLELWESMGFIDEALARGHRVQGLSLCTPKKKIGTITLTDLPTKYPFILVLPQAKTEHLLTEHLSTLGVTVERGVCLNDLSQERDHVKVVCNGVHATYSWVIGCDGVHSSVRELTQIPFQGQDLAKHFIMADLHIDWDKPSHFAHGILAEKGPLMFLPFDQVGHGRLIIDVTGDSKWKQNAQPHLEDFQQLLDERTHLKTTLSRATWISSFWVQERIAQQYRKGRVFLAGDAAHRHSPLGGQGLNTGIQDAYFLGTLLGTGNLDEYEKIRRPIGEKIIRRTSAMTHLISSRSKLVQVVRNFFLHHLLKSNTIRRKAAMILSQLIYKN